jgi:hypothetical protein
MIGLMLNLRKMQPARLAPRRQVTIIYTLKMSSIQHPCMLRLVKKLLSMALVYLLK